MHDFNKAAIGAAYAIACHDQIHLHKLKLSILEQKASLIFWPT